MRGTKMEGRCERGRKMKERGCERGRKNEGEKV